MKWRGRRGSRNIEDRRGMGAAAGGIGGVGLLAIVLVGWFFGIDLTPLLQQGGSAQVGGGAPTEVDQHAADFVSVTLADTEEVWGEVFETQLDASYDPPVLVLFSGATRSGCGGASAATGPFYCPADQKVYLDTDFFDTLERQLGARGDFAAAYVVAHEVAHHVQDELGILGEANSIRRQVGEAEANAISVRIELQADCYSGIWARRAEARFGSLEPGDVEEAMNAAARIGDDTLQRQQGGVVRPESFTHGTSEQRQTWFAHGYEDGDAAVLRYVRDSEPLSCSWEPLVDSDRGFRVLRCRVLGRRWPEWRNGRRSGFKIRRLRSCEFESRLGHHLRFWEFPGNGAYMMHAASESLRATFTSGAPRATLPNPRVCRGR